MCVCVCKLLRTCYAVEIALGPTSCNCGLCFDYSSYIILVGNEVDELEIDTKPQLNHRLHGSLIGRLSKPPAEQCPHAHATPAQKSYQQRSSYTGARQVSGVGNGGHMNFSIWMPGGVRSDAKAA